ncbi:Activator of stress genes 1 [Madurella mycetomatis]|uniref:Activator of stress genes 1 n=1 Tax=Madurella mycetomatis TaxID=100816 RepID=A0A175WCC0_9PEZI|nr:Activator of stress genes 1 [Madurella mycetomatis]KXX81275.1 Activator of stress genes 1 [Madurella mycetomatis]
MANVPRTLVDIDRRLQRLEKDARANPGTSQRVASDAVPPASRPSNASVQNRDNLSLGGSPDTLAEEDELDAAISANSTFMRHGLEAAARPPLQHDLSTSSKPPKAELDSPVFPSLVGFSLDAPEEPYGDILPEAIVLPPRPFADDLLRWYWQHVHSIFPFLHWPTFENQYHALWGPRKPPGTPVQEFEEIVFHASLNMVLGLACQRNDSLPPAQRQHQAEEFYKRSRRLISIESIDTASVPVVQLLLLRGMYLYFSGRADRCWLMIGAAVRVAIGMSLHVTPKKPLNQLEREMRRRVWYGGCVTLDQILASTFGRAGITHTVSQPPLPLAIDDEYLSTTQEGRQPDNVPSRMELILWSVKQLEIMDAMRTAVRAPRLKISRTGGEFTVPDPAAVLRVNSMIDDQLEALPPYLRVGADYSKMPISDDDVICFRNQSHAIRFRLVCLRILALRPSLLAEAHRWASSAQSTAQSTASLMLQERLHREACLLCLTTVHSILEEIHSNLTTKNQVSPWYALHFAFASATALLVATLSPDLGVNLCMEPAKSSWDRALAIMEFHKMHALSATRAIEVLQRYRQSISLHFAARMGTIPPTTQSPQDIMITQTTQSPEQEQLKYGQRQQQQHYAESWEQAQAILSPSITGMGMIGGLDEFLTSESLDAAWLNMQDFGQGDWMLHC